MLAPYIFLTLACLVGCVYAGSCPCTRLETHRFCGTFASPAAGDECTVDRVIDYRTGLEAPVVSNASSASCTCAQPSDPTLRDFFDVHYSRYIEDDGVALPRPCYSPTNVHLPCTREQTHALCGTPLVSDGGLSTRIVELTSSSLGTIRVPTNARGYDSRLCVMRPFMSGTASLVNHTCPGAYTLRTCTTEEASNWCLLGTAHDEIHACMARCPTDSALPCELWGQCTTRETCTMPEAQRLCNNRAASIAGCEAYVVQTRSGLERRAIIGTALQCDAYGTCERSFESCECVDGFSGGRCDTIDLDTTTYTGNEALYRCGVGAASVAMSDDNSTVVSCTCKAGFGRPALNVSSEVRVVAGVHRPRHTIHSVPLACSGIQRACTLDDVRHYAGEYGASCVITCPVDEIQLTINTEGAANPVVLVSSRRGCLLNSATCMDGVEGLLGESGRAHALSDMFTRSFGGYWPHHRPCAMPNTAPTGMLGVYPSDGDIVFALPVPVVIPWDGWMVGQYESGEIADLTRRHGGKPPSRLRVQSIFTHLRKGERRSGLSLLNAPSQVTNNCTTLTVTEERDACGDAVHHTARIVLDPCTGVPITEVFPADHDTSPLNTTMGTLSQVGTLDAAVVETVDAALDVVVALVEPTVACGCVFSAYALNETHGAVNLTARCSRSALASVHMSHVTTCTCKDVPSGITVVESCLNEHGTYVTHRVSEIPLQVTYDLSARVEAARQLFVATDHTCGSAEVCTPLNMSITTTDVVDSTGFYKVFTPCATVEFCASALATRVAQRNASDAVCACEISTRHAGDGQVQHILGVTATRGADVYDDFLDVCRCEVDFAHVQLYVATEYSDLHPVHTFVAHVTPPTLDVHDVFGGLAQSLWSNANAHTTATTCPEHLCGLTIYRVEVLVFDRSNSSSDSFVVERVYHACPIVPCEDASAAIRHVYQWTDFTANVSQCVLEAAADEVGGDITVRASCRGDGAGLPTCEYHRYGIHVSVACNTPYATNTTTGVGTTNMTLVCEWLEASRVASVVCPTEACAVPSTSVYTARLGAASHLGCAHLTEHSLSCRPDHCDCVREETELTSCSTVTCGVGTRTIRLETIVEPNGNGAACPRADLEDGLHEISCGEECPRALVCGSQTTSVFATTSLPANSTQCVCEACGTHLGGMTYAYDIVATCRSDPLTTNFRNVPTTCYCGTYLNEDLAVTMGDGFSAPAAQYVHVVAPCTPNALNSRVVKQVVVQELTLGTEPFESLPVDLRGTTMCTGIQDTQYAHCNADLSAVPVGTGVSVLRAGTTLAPSVKAALSILSSGVHEVPSGCASTGRNGECVACSQVYPNVGGGDDPGSPTLARVQALLTANTNDTVDAFCGCEVTVEDEMCGVTTDSYYVHVRAFCGTTRVSLVPRTCECRPTALATSWFGSFPSHFSRAGYATVACPTQLGEVAWSLRDTNLVLPSMLARVTPSRNAYIASNCPECATNPSCFCVVPAELTRVNPHNQTHVAESMFTAMEVAAAASQINACGVGNLCTGARLVVDPEGLKTSITRETLAGSTLLTARVTHHAAYAIHSCGSSVASCYSYAQQVAFPAQPLLVANTTQCVCELLNVPDTADGGSSMWLVATCRTNVLDAASRPPCVCSTRSVFVPVVDVIATAACTTGSMGTTSSTLFAENSGGDSAWAYQPFTTAIADMWNALPAAVGPCENTCSRTTTNGAVSAVVTTVSSAFGYAKARGFLVTTTNCAANAQCASAARSVVFPAKAPPTNGTQCVCEISIFSATLYEMRATCRMPVGQSVGVLGNVPSTCTCLTAGYQTVATCAAALAGGTNTVTFPRPASATVGAPCVSLSNHVAALVGCTGAACYLRGVNKQSTTFEQTTTRCVYESTFVPCSTNVRCDCAQTVVETNGACSTDAYCGTGYRRARVLTTALPAFGGTPCAHRTDVSSDVWQAITCMSTQGECVFDLGGAHNFSTTSARRLAPVPTLTANSGECFCEFSARRVANTLYKYTPPTCNGGGYTTTFTDCADWQWMVRQTCTLPTFVEGMPEGLVCSCAHVSYSRSYQTPIYTWDKPSYKAFGLVNESSTWWNWVGGYAYNYPALADTFSYMYDGTRTTQCVYGTTVTTNYTVYDTHDVRAGRSMADFGATFVPYIGDNAAYSGASGRYPYVSQQSLVTIPLSPAPFRVVHASFHQFNLTAVNCVWGAWVAQGGCDVTCGSGGIRLETRSVSTPASNGGAACQGSASRYLPCSAATACPSECLVSDWGAFSSCNPSTNFKGRRRAVTCGSDADVAVLGSWCVPYLGPLLGSVDSYTDAVFTGISCAHNDAAGCCGLHPCARDHVPHDNFVRIPPNVREEALRLSPFNASKACVDNSFTTTTASWPVVTNPGGDGSLHRIKTRWTTRTMATRDASCTDCVWSDWVTVGPECSSPCYEGSRMETRTVLTPATEGGAPCEGPTHRVVNCVGTGECDGCAVGPFVPITDTAGRITHRTRAVRATPLCDNACICNAGAMPNATHLCAYTSVQTCTSAHVTQLGASFRLNGHACSVACDNATTCHTFLGAVFEQSVRTILATDLLTSVCGDHAESGTAECIWPSATGGTGSTVQCTNPTCVCTTVGTFNTTHLCGRSYNVAPCAEEDVTRFCGPHGAACSKRCREIDGVGTCYQAHVCTCAGVPASGLAYLDSQRLNVSDPASAAYGLVESVGGLYYARCDEPVFDNTAALRYLCGPFVADQETGCIADPETGEVTCSLGSCVCLDGAHPDPLLDPSRPCEVIDTPCTVDEAASVDCCGSIAFQCTAYVDGTGFRRCASSTCVPRAPGEFRPCLQGEELMVACGMGSVSGTCGADGTPPSNPALRDCVCDGAADYFFDVTTLRCASAEPQLHACSSDPSDALYYKTLCPQGGPLLGPADCRVRVFPLPASLEGFPLVVDIRPCSFDFCTSMDVNSTHAMLLRALWAYQSDPTTRPTLLAMSEADLRFSESSASPVAAASVECRCVTPWTVDVPGESAVANAYEWSSELASLLRRIDDLDFAMHDTSPTCNAVTASTFGIVRELYGACGTFEGRTCGGRGFCTTPLNQTMVDTIITSGVVSLAGAFPKVWWTGEIPADRRIFNRARIVQLPRTFTLVEENTTSLECAVKIVEGLRTTTEIELPCSSGGACQIGGQRIHELLPALDGIPPSALGEFAERRGNAFDYLGVNPTNTERILSSAPGLRLEALELDMAALRAGDVDWASIRTLTMGHLENNPDYRRRRDTGRRVHTCESRLTPEMGMRACDNSGARPLVDDRPWVSERWRTQDGPYVPTRRTTDPFSALYESNAFQAIPPSGGLRQEFAISYEVTGMPAQANGRPPVLPSMVCTSTKAYQLNTTPLQPTLHNVRSYNVFPLYKHLEGYAMNEVRECTLPQEVQTTSHYPFALIDIPSRFPGFISAESMSDVDGSVVVRSTNDGSVLGCGNEALVPWTRIHDTTTGFTLTSSVPGFAVVPERCFVVAEFSESSENPCRPLGTCECKDPFDPVNGCQSGTRSALGPIYRIFDGAYNSVGNDCPAAYGAADVLAGRPWLVDTFVAEEKRPACSLADGWTGRVGCVHGAWDYAHGRCACDPGWRRTALPPSDKVEFWGIFYLLIKLLGSEGNTYLSHSTAVPANWEDALGKPLLNLTGSYIVEPGDEPITGAQLAQQLRANATAFADAILAGGEVGVYADPDNPTDEEINALVARIMEVMTTEVLFRIYAFATASTAAAPSYEAFVANASAAFASAEAFTEAFGGVGACTLTLADACANVPSYANDTTSFGLYGVCNGHGVKDPAGTCTCKCEPGYAGRYCTQCPVAVATGKPCNHAGVCVDGATPSDDPVCSCMRGADGTGGFTGEACDVSETVGEAGCNGIPTHTSACSPLDDPADIVNGLTLCATLPFWECICDGSWFGPNCTQTLCPTVGGRVCNDHGACVKAEGASSWHCACEAPTSDNTEAWWSGAACDADLRAYCYEPIVLEGHTSDTSLCNLDFEDVLAIGADVVCPYSFDVNGGTSDYACDCSKRPSIYEQLRGPFCTESFCGGLEADENGCAGRLCATDGVNDGTCMCGTPRRGGGLITSVLLGPHCELDATDKCGVPYISQAGHEILECGTRNTPGAIVQGTCVCESEYVLDDSTCGCVCMPGYYGSMCQISNCTAHCGDHGKCSPQPSGTSICECIVPPSLGGIFRQSGGEGSGSPCTIDACAHPTDDSANDVLARAVVPADPTMAPYCECHNTSLRWDTGAFAPPCTLVKCPVVDGFRCGVPFVGDHCTHGGDPATCDTSFKYCNTRGACVCGQGYNASSDGLTCVPYCSQAGTLSVSSNADTGQVVCTCKAPSSTSTWTGERCDTLTCGMFEVMTPDGLSCECAPGRSGESCSVAECANGGTREPGHTDGACECPTGWTGSLCDVSSCHEAGAVYSASALKCNCSEHRSGTFCEVLVCGTRHVSNGTACVCAPNLSGDTCEQRTCLNGGTNVLGAPLSCACHPAFEGLSCETSRCGNGMPSSDGYGCVCNTGWLRAPTVLGACTVPKPSTPGGGSGGGGSGGVTPPPPVTPPVDPPVIVVPPSDCPPSRQGVRDEITGLIDCRPPPDPTPVPPVVTPVTPPTTTTTTSSKLSAGAIAGIVVGAVAGIALLVVFLWKFTAGTASKVSAFFKGFKPLAGGRE